MRENGGPTSTGKRRPPTKRTEPTAGRNAFLSGEESVVIRAPRGKSPRPIARVARKPFTFRIIASGPLHSDPHCRLSCRQRWQASPLGSVRYLTVRRRRPADLTDLEGGSEITRADWQPTSDASRGRREPPPAARCKEVRTRTRRCLHAAHRSRAPRGRARVPSL